MFSDEITELASRAKHPQVKSLLEHAAKLEAALPEYRAATVRVRQKGCKGCGSGVVFKGSERMTGK